MARVAWIALLLCGATTQAATVTYTMQTGNFNSLLLEKNNNPPYAGTYNNTASELGNYANGGSFGNTPGAAAFQTFTTTGNGISGTTRALQVGDTFTITGYVGANPSVGGRIGISFRDSTTYTDFFSSTDNTTEARFQLDNTGGWKIYNNGAARDSGLGAGADRTFVIKVTSSTTFDAQVGGTWYYNNTMAASGGSIDSFSIYTLGDSNANSFWKSASLADTGTVQLGYAGANGTTYTPGVVSDGLAADSASTAVANAVFIGGDSGSAIVLNQQNTYTGATTVNANATARASHANAFGTTAGGVSVTSGGAIELSGGITVGTEALTLNGTGISSGGALRNTANDNTWQGDVTLGSASSVVATSGTLTLSGNTALGGNRLTIGGGSGVTVTGQISGTVNSDILKQGAGALTLSGDNSGLNSAGDSLFIDQGTVYLNHNNAGGAKDIDLGSGIVPTGGSAALYATGGRTIGNAITVQGENTTALSIGSDSTTDDNTFTGNIALEKTANFNAGSGRNVTFSTGALSGAGGLTKTGLGTVTLSGNNGYAGATVVSSGVLNLNASSGSAAGSTASVSVANNAKLLISQSNQVNNNATVSLSGGTIQRASGVTETFGALTLSAASTLDFGTGTANSLNFGTYTGGGFKLNVTNFLQGNILTFKNDLSLSINNTSLFGFDNGFTSNWNSGASTFTITAIPEPSTYLAAAGLFALFLWPIRRRLLKDARFLLGLCPTGRAAV